QVLRNRLAELTGSIEALNEQLVKKRDVLREQVRNVQTLEAETQQVRSRHAALKKMDENYEWYKEGIRSIMKTSKSKNPEETGIHGLVAEVIDVEPSYEDAVEVALGDTLQYVIVSDQEGGVAAIDHLRAESAGRGGFIPMKEVKPVVGVDTDHIQANLPDAHSLLLDHVKVRKGYEGLIQYLVGHVVISENLKAALQLWNRNGLPHTVVTRQGDSVCSQGILIGGSPDQAASGILTKKKEIRELSKKLSNLERAATEAKSIQASLETETIDFEIRIQKAKQSEQEMHQDDMDVDKELYRLGEEFKHCEHRTKILGLEAEQIEGEETDLVGELSKYEEMLSQLSREMDTAESTINETSKEISEVSGIQESVNQKLLGLRLDLTRLEAQRDNVQSTLHRLSSFQDERLDKLNQLNRQLKQKGQDNIALGQKLEENRSRIARLYAELETAEEVLSGMETQYQAIENMLEENERALSDIGGAQQEVSQKIQQLELKQTERRMRCEHLANRIRETYHSGLERVNDQNDAEALSVEEMEEALVRYREQIARIGDVNLAAIEEYEALAERYQFLTEQRDDLIEAIEALRRVIRKINRKSLRQFMRTFKAVNEKLQQVFPSLFEGGAAKLVLTDPKKPLESGVSYLVHPPGKKLTRMSLLSGGEKALSAIALVFSLFLIKPTAFCVFDEIDAPLDDVNTDRFNVILQQIGRDSQVILVTHNKRTMEVADALFGVTMEHKGVSKLISINLEN
ncbi:MAG: hypothetical protein JRI47_07685, partial [Deltaproteobacteria bacterium]|nr:hypothetical protein [Deltaproteobacteria bacterium]